MKSAKVFTRERWRSVPGYPAYQVSSSGRVRSLGTAKRPEGGVLRCSPSRATGYRYATLYRGEKGRTAGKKVKVAVLVLTAFVGPGRGLDARHLDDVKTNDTLRNLSWGTRRDNVCDAIANGKLRTGSRNPATRISYEQYLDILRSEEPGSVLSRRYGVSPGLVSMYRNGKRRRVS